MALRISYAVRAHPQRKSWAQPLAARLNCPIVYDVGDGDIETGYRALSLGSSGGRGWHVVIEDDAVLCDDFEKHAAAILSQAAHHPVSFYTGAPRPYTRQIRPAVRRARDDGIGFLAMRGPFWGVAFAVPRTDIPTLLEGYQSHNGDYEYRVAEYYTRRAVDCWYPQPSLVDHRPGPSLLRGKEGNRNAYWWEQHVGERAWEGVLPVRELQARDLRKLVGHRPSGF